MKKLTSLALLAALFVGTPALTYAETHIRTTRETTVQNANHYSDTGTRFHGLDRNNDGRISRSEWKGHSNAFSVHDSNRDGFLSGMEVSSWSSHSNRAGMRYMFNDLDMNNNGVLSMSEYPGTRNQFRSVDSNNDGVLSRSEAVSHTWVVSRNSMDRNNDRLFGGNEWNTGSRSFTNMDRDGNRMINNSDINYADGRRTGFRSL